MVVLIKFSQRYLFFSKYCKTSLKAKKSTLTECYTENNIVIIQCFKISFKMLLRRSA